MSVITVPEATPNRVEIIVRAVAACGEAGVPIQELRQQLAARILIQGSQRQDSGVHLAALNETIALGLVTRGADGRCRAGEELQRANDTGEFAPFRDQMAGILLDPERAGRRGQGQFARALAWFLEQDPARPIQFSGAGFPARIEKDVGEDVGAFELIDDSPRWQQFTYWACYLGYGWRLRAGREFVVPDPTDVLAAILGPLLQARGTLPIRDAITSWAAASPVLEGGTVRTQVYELIHTRPTEQPPRLSASTSLALSRLEDRGLVRLISRSDATEAILQTGRTRRSFSHIALAGEA